jgi:hypothetical protein
MDICRYFGPKNSVDRKESLALLLVMLFPIFRNSFGQFRTYVRNLSGKALFANMKRHLSH